MAREYTQVLKGQNVSFLVIGRGEDSAKKFTEKTNVKVNLGGIDSFLKQEPELPVAAIVCVGVEQLAFVTTHLLNYGVKRILVEKPGGTGCSELSDLVKLTAKNEAKVYLAYNRRFYSATKKAIEIINKDNGVASFNFEFTEWSHKIGPLKKGKGVKEAWFLANSTHVADLAFFLGGFPQEIHCHTSGGLDWHPSASIFSGSGISKKNALFSYQANWQAPGRWTVEILTQYHRLIFCPMEKLQIQEVGSLAISFVDIDDRLDKEYKPGLYLQVKSFLEGNINPFCTIQEQMENMEYYNKMANYN